MKKIQDKYCCNFLINNIMRLFFVIKPTVTIMTMLISICTAKEETRFWLQRIGYNNYFKTFK